MKLSISACQIVWAEENSKKLLINHSLQSIKHLVRGHLPVQAQYMHPKTIKMGSYVLYIYAPSVNLL